MANYAGLESDAHVPKTKQLVQKLTGELLASSWDKFDSDLQQKLTELGISPPPPSPEPDLQDVLRDNLAQLPAPVKELVEKITKPQPPTEKDVANKLKQQVSSLRDLSHRKQHLQSKIDATKKAFQDLLNEMKLIQTKIEQEQAELNNTSAAYMTLVSKQPDPVHLVEDAEMKDPVPEAVAGFISTLGVSLTQEQQDQLKSMPTDSDGLSVHSSGLLTGALGPVWTEEQERSFRQKVTAIFLEAMVLLLHSCPELKLNDDVPENVSKDPRAEVRQSNAWERFMALPSNSPRRQLFDQAIRLYSFWSAEPPESRRSPLEHNLRDWVTRPDLGRRTLTEERALGTSMWSAPAAGSIPEALAATPFFQETLPL
eukprot:g16734.t1